jgi:predicted transcriptional regulator
MKTIRALAAVLFHAFLCLQFAPAIALEFAQPRPVSAIQITTGEPGAAGAYYFISNGGWGAAGCPNAVYAFVRAERNQAKDLMAAVMLAKAMNTHVQLIGTCLNQNYFEATMVAW